MGQTATANRTRSALLSSGFVRAAILAVGSELLSTDRLDTNSLRVAELLELHGVPLVRKSVVGDDDAAIAAEILAALAAAELLIVGGGLGPTADDVTREACAAALGRELSEAPDVWSAIERRFARLGRQPSANNRRQAKIVVGARVLENLQGTAPGQRIELEDGRTIFLLPGVPDELDELLRRELEPWLAARSSGVGCERRTLKVASRAESEVDAALTPVYAEYGRASITILAGSGEIKIRLAASGDEGSRRARLDAMAAAVRRELGDAIFGEGDDLSLEEVVASLLFTSCQSIATAESCTGGLLAERLTRVPGASRFFPGGVVAYSNEQKSRLVGVEDELLSKHGAVSQAVAEAMAEGVRKRFDTDFGVGVTGVAGPDGGSAEKPVGTIHLALAGRGGELAHRHVRLPGDRRRVRWLATQVALELLRKRLLEAARAGAA